MAQKKKKNNAGRSSRSSQSLSGHLLKIIAGALILAGLVAAAGLTALFLLPSEQSALRHKVPATGDKPQRPVYEIYPEEEPTEPPPATEPLATSPLVAIIIDDLGYDLPVANSFLKLGEPLTFAILPFGPHSKKIAKAAHARGNEVMLHLPMEPEGYPRVNPGPGVLLTSMTPDLLIRQLKKNLADVPHISGVNNHMGSELTKKSNRLYQIFSILKKEQLFFIDSRTTESSLCRPSAKLLHVPFAERNVFIDNSLTEQDVRRQLLLLLKTAEHRGAAIGIGHPHSITCRVLKKMLPEIKNRVRLVPASRLVRVIDS
ncbi:MAG: divergent polysaccharide deacetylase family protein [Desulfosudaceae bacterium]